MRRKTTQSAGRQTLTPSNHAVQQYCIRTGRSPLCGTDLYHAVKSGTSISYREALDLGFSIIHKFHGDSYIVWYDENIKENICGILSGDGVLKTVLTLEIYSHSYINGKIRHDNRFKSRFIYNKDGNRTNSDYCA